MATRPGYVWDDVADEWVEIGQAAVVSPFKYQATAPTSPATGDIWIESDVDVPSVDSAQFLRWRKTMAGGETSLSGNDDSSLPLGYTPGYEQLYINGVLMVRGQDYTATTGTTVTGLTALTVNDVVEVFSTLARTVADVYTQTQVDSKLGESGWTLYTPTLDNVTLGTGGSSNFYWNQIGKTVFVKGNIVLGSSGFSINGSVSFSFPVTSAAQAAYPLGVANYIDGGTIYEGIVRYTSNTSAAFAAISAGGTYASYVNLSSSIPFTWGASDAIRFQMMYEAA
jgi:hypothetical protein